MARNTDKKEKPEETARTNEKVGAGQQSTDASNRTYMLVGALVVVLLLGFSLWQLGFFAGASAKPAGVANNTTSVSQLSMPQAGLLSGLINKTRNIPASYQIRYLENTDGTSREIAVSSDGTWTEVQTQTPVYARTYFWAGNQTVLCENNNESAACAVLNETDDKWAEAQAMGEMTFPAKNQSGRIWESYQKLINNSEFRFIGEAQERSIANRTCKEITYRFGENNITVCLDSQYGVVLGQKMTYNQPYQQTGSTQILYRKAAYKIEALELGFAGRNITEPAIENSTKAANMAKTDDEAWAAMQDCQSLDEGADKHRCFKDNAIGFNDARFCEQNINMTALGDCVIKVATQTGKLAPELCERAGEMKSECYANIAYLKNDSSYCRLVSDEELRKTCDKAMGSATGGQ